LLLLGGQFHPSLHKNRDIICRMIIIARFSANIQLKSPWVFHYNTGGCDVCEKEISPSLQKKYGIEQVAVLFNSSPQSADILLVTGPITEDSVEGVWRVYEQMRTPRAVVAVGSCPASDKLFETGPWLAGSYGSIIPIDVYVPGCPPKREAISKGLQAAVQILTEGRHRCIRGQGRGKRF
jgi:membrane-bound hydrogenase subunit mbhJ